MEAAASVVRACHCQTRNRVPTVSSGRPRCGSCQRDLPWLVDATEATFDAAVDAGVPVLVDLWASWCGPCRTIAPAIEHASVALAGQLKVVKVDVEAFPGVSARLGVQGIPTLVLMRGGTEIARQVGAVPGDRLLEWVRESIS